MKKIKETKEELIVKNAELKHDLEQEQLKDQRIRKEFSIILNFRKSQKYSEFGASRVYLFGDNTNKSSEPPLLSWEQIFTEVGKLLSARNFYDFEGNVSELECKLEELEKKISQNIEKKV